MMARPTSILCMLALLFLTACGGSGASDNTLLTGLSGGAGGNPTATVVVPSATAPVQDGTGTGMTDAELAWASELFSLVNEYRTTHVPPLPAVAWHVNLAGVAMAHSVDMQTVGAMSHDGPAPCAYPEDCLGQRLLTAGILYLTAGENVARGFVDPNLLMEAWILSPAHNFNLPGKDWTHAGIGWRFGPSPGNPAALGPWATLNFIEEPAVGP